MHGYLSKPSAAGYHKTIAMYKTILVPVENRETDQTILQHIRPLARLTHAKLMLVHVADGWAARFEVSSVLAMGEPSTEIIKLARAEPVDLIAMTTHGHRFISDLLYGATADKVRHEVDVPVLLLKVKS